MVKGIFCHYLPIYKDINGEYCSTTLTDSLFKRYLEVVDILIVATRVYELGCTYQEAHQEKITLKLIKYEQFIKPCFKSFCKSFCCRYSSISNSALNCT